MNAISGAYSDSLRSDPSSTTNSGYTAANPAATSPTRSPPTRRPSNPAATTSTGPIRHDIPLGNERVDQQQVVAGFEREARHLGSELTRVPLGMPRRPAPDAGRDLLWCAHDRAPYTGPGANRRAPMRGVLLM
jgi:hypothetical protein